MCLKKHALDAQWPPVKVICAVLGRLLSRAVLRSTRRTDPELV